MPSNKELRERKNCELYAYLLTSLGKEVPDEIIECITTYDYPLDCVADLSAEIRALDEEMFEKILNDKESPHSRELAIWWKTYQEADKLSQDLKQTCL